MQSFSTSTAVIQPKGSLDASNAGEFQQQLTSYLQAAHAELMVDMSGVEALDSAGLISLVSGLKLARQNSKRFCLCAVPPSIQIVFELTQLDRVFEMIEDVPMVPLAA